MCAHFFMVDTMLGGDLRVAVTSFCTTYSEGGAEQVQQLFGTIAAAANR